MLLHILHLLSITYFCQFIMLHIK